MVMWLNNNLIPDLPTNSCVEVPCDVKGKLTPQAVPALPLHLNRFDTQQISQFNS